MSIPDLCASWKKANYLPEEMRQEHIDNLEKVDVEVIEGRIHVDVMNTLIKQDFNADTIKYDLIKPVQDLVLKLIDEGKEVHLISSLLSKEAKYRLTKAGADKRIIDLDVIDRNQVMSDTMMGQKSKYEMLIDDSPERPAAMHATRFDPSEIVKLATNEPS